MRNLKDESERLDKVLSAAVVGWQNQLKEVEEQIKEYESILAEKESKTDRSENATFQIASDGRANKIAVRQILTEKLNAYVEHKANYTPTGTVSVGSTICIRSDSDELIVKIVSRGLSDDLNGLISEDSPVGKNALGLTTGSTFAVKTRRGKIEYRIEGVY